MISFSDGCMSYMCCLYLRVGRRLAFWAVRAKHSTSHTILRAIGVPFEMVNTKWELRHTDSQALYERSQQSKHRQFYVSVHWSSRVCYLANLLLLLLMLVLFLTLVQTIHFFLIPTQTIFSNRNTYRVFTSDIMRNKLNISETKQFFWQYLS